MKKIIASVLFFGSFGVAAAQYGDSPDNWQYKPEIIAPQCGVTKVRKTYSHESYPEHCESPGHQTVVNPDPLTGLMPLDTPYPYPNNNAVADFFMGHTVNGVRVKGWRETHSNIRFVDSRTGSCNDLKTEGACNAAMVKGKKIVAYRPASSFTAALVDTFASFRAFLGFSAVTSAVPAGMPSQASGRLEAGEEMTPGCLWHGQRIDKEEKSGVACTACQSANMKADAAFLEYERKTAEVMRKCMYGMSGGVPAWCDVEMQRIHDTAIVRANAAGRGACTSSQCRWTGSAGGTGIPDPDALAVLKRESCVPAPMGEQCKTSEDCKGGSSCCYGVCQSGKRACVPMMY